MKAAGESVVGFGAGEPDFPTPAHIVEAAVEACRDPKNHRYSPAGGLPELKEAIAAKTMRDSGYQVDPSQVLVTNGGKHAVYTAFEALCDPGDEVLLFVSPDNPSGAVYSPAEVRAIGEWAVEHGIWVVTDEIYEHLTYGNHEFASMPTLVPDIAEQCLVLNGVAKTYAMTGWRVGWLIGPNDVVKACTNFQSHVTSNVANVAQRAALAAVSGTLDDVVMMREAFTRRGTNMHRLLNDIDGVTCIEPQGAFYCFPNVSGLLGRDINGQTATNTLELADLVLEQAKVAFVPGEAFGAPGYARFSFALGDDDLEEGIRRIAELVG